MSQTEPKAQEAIACCKNHLLGQVMDGIEARIKHVHEHIGGQLADELQAADALICL